MFSGPPDFASQLLIGQATIVRLLQEGLELLRQHQVLPEFLAPRPPSGTLQTGASAPPVDYTAVYSMVCINCEWFVFL